MNIYPYSPGRVMEGVVGSHTLRETQGHISMTSVPTRVWNDSQIGEVTCGYRSEHEYGTNVTHDKHSYH